MAAIDQELELNAAESLVQRYLTVRHNTEALCAPLRTEDYVVQSMPDASPSKWHIAHVTWFFEQFILAEHCPDYRKFDPQFAFLFNSYYVSMGERHLRPERGLLSRPTVSQIMDYRQYVDEALSSWILEIDADQLLTIEPLVTLGLNHEQQHQELLLMDIKHAFFQNPLLPAYRETTAQAKPAAELTWINHPGGITQTGRNLNDGFCYDNETPKHQSLLQPFAIAERLTTNAEWLTFMDDGGYEQHQHWLSDGWAWLEAEQVKAPLYWVKKDDQWMEFSLNGLHPIDPNAPVCHISFYEADAYASWAGARLPTEFEWEASAPTPSTETANTHPDNASQWYSQTWQWTRSSYSPYPGFKALEGALGEYNGKFMNNQMVMRGSACVTPPGHTRQSYRNFFYPHMRWQFSGLRLAKDGGA